MFRCDNVKPSAEKGTLMSSCPQLSNPLMLKGLDRLLGCADAGEAVNHQSDQGAVA
jgi:hypothetical protein